MTDRTLADLMTEARQNARVGHPAHVVEGTTANGDMLAYANLARIEMPDEWARIQQVGGNCGPGRIVGDNVVRAGLRFCAPDVELVHIDESLFDSAEVNHV